MSLAALRNRWQKIKNLRANAQNFEMMGFRPGIFWGTIVALTETIGSLAVILGLGTQIISFASKPGLHTVKLNVNDDLALDNIGNLVDVNMINHGG